MSNQPPVVLMLLIYFEQPGHKAHEKNSTYSSDLSGKEHGKLQVFSKAHYYKGKKLRELGKKSKG